MKNSTRPRQSIAAGAQGVLFAAGGGTGSTVPLPKVARPVVVITRGRVEYVARCPGCGQWHRHLSLGEKTGPCGAEYTVAPRRGTTRRAA